MFATVPRWPAALRRPPSERQFVRPLAFPGAWPARPGDCDGEQTTQLRPPAPAHTGQTPSGPVGQPESAIRLIACDFLTMLILSLARAWSITDYPLMCLRRKAELTTILAYKYLDPHVFLAA